MKDTWSCITSVKYMNFGTHLYTGPGEKLNSLQNIYFKLYSATRVKLYLMFTKNITGMISHSPIEPSPLERSVL